MAELEPEDLEEWQALEQIDGPWGEWRDDLRIARAASALCSALGAKISAKEIMPDFQPKRRLTNAEIHERMGLWAAALNAVDKRRAKRPSPTRTLNG